MARAGRPPRGKPQKAWAPGVHGRGRWGQAGAVVGPEGRECSLSSGEASLRGRKDATGRAEPLVLGDKRRASAGPVVPLPGEELESGGGDDHPNGATSVVTQEPLSSVRTPQRPAPGTWTPEDSLPGRLCCCRPAAWVCRDSRTSLRHWETPRSRTQGTVVSGGCCGVPAFPGQGPSRGSPGHPTSPAIGKMPPAHLR